MYVPNFYRSRKWDTAKEIIDSYPLATVITAQNNRPFANHLPLFLDKQRSGENGIIWGHMDRANPQVEQLRDLKTALLIFHGPQAYVSSRWYKKKPNAPTWNYVTVHVTGSCRLLDDPSDILTVLKETSARLEPQQGREIWAKDLIPADWAKRMVEQIVGIQFEIQGYECSLKLGQNKDKEDILGAIAGLREESVHLPGLADWMERENGR
jgi:transcriptional regulator